MLCSCPQADAPVVIEGAMENWQALRKWSDLHALRQLHGHRTIPVEIGSHASGSLKVLSMSFSRLLHGSLMFCFVTLVRQRLKHRTTIGVHASVLTKAGVSYLCNTCSSSQIHICTGHPLLQTSIFFSTGLMSVKDAMQIKSHPLLTSSFNEIYSQLSGINVWIHALCWGFSSFLNIFLCPHSHQRDLTHLIALKKFDYASTIPFFQNETYAILLVRLWNTIASACARNRCGIRDSRRHYAPPDLLPEIPRTQVFHINVVLELHVETW